MPSPLGSFDEELRGGLGFSRLVGVDEAGRGPLAGPVVAAAVLLPPGVTGLDEVRDSKALSARVRQRLFALIRSKAEGVGVGWALPREIDERNILRASLLAMRRALDRCRNVAGCGRAEGFCALVDGNQPVPDIGCSQRCLVQGDARSLCVAAASVIAKVVRDRWMQVLDFRHPGYGFGRHKGYGTAEHLQALRRLGPCPEHRRSFAPVAGVLAAREALREENGAAAHRGSA